MPNEEQFKSKRADFAQKIRRQEREEIISKRRNLSDSKPEQEEGTSGNKTQNKTYHIIDSRFAQQISVFHKLAVNPQELKTYFTAIHNPDIVQQHFGVIMIRKLLTSKTDPPIQRIIDSGFIPKLIQYAKQSEYPQIQLQAIWCLANVAAGTTQQTSSIIDKGGIRIFVDLVRSEHVGVVEQAVWALGNIASDSPAYRDMIIKAGGIPNLTTMFYIVADRLRETPDLAELVNSFIWVLGAICRTKPLANYMLVKDIFPIFYKVINENLVTDKVVQTHVCWALSYYIDGKKQGKDKINKIKQIIDSGVLVKIIDFTSNPSDQLAVSSLKIIGNVANSAQPSEILGYLNSIGVIPKTQKLLYSNKKVCRKQACWILSSLAASCFEETQQLLKSNQLFVKLFSMLKSDLPDVRAQICYFFANLMDSGDANQTIKLDRQTNLTNLLADILKTSTDRDEIYACLQCIQTILQTALKVFQNKNNISLENMFNLGIINKIQDLQHHEDERIYEQVVSIIRDYLEVENPLKM